MDRLMENRSMSWPSGMIWVSLSILIMLPVRVTNPILTTTEKGDTKTRVNALQKLILLILNGEKFPPSMLMAIIRYILPVQDHTLKKMLLIFWEIVPKRGADGKLLHEMILVCDAYRKDLQHPNEFIRGSTLRFLCKLKEPELLEPLMPSIRSCLEHRHSYVRRNAVLAIFKIYINFEQLIPDAPELIMDFLSRETDASCKRNAFLMLIHLDQSKALDYLNSCLDQISSFNDILQLVIVELIYKVCIANPSERSRFIRAIYNLLNSSTSPSVRYEAAATLITLSQAPTALKAAANCFIDICLKESDNNVKLIVLDRLIGLKDSAPAAEKVLQEALMDILRILTVATDLEVKNKILKLALELISLRNSEEMVHLLKKEVIKTQNDSITSNDDTGKYRVMLVQTLHSICIKFPEVLSTNNLLTTLSELLSADDQQTAQLVIDLYSEFLTKNMNSKDIILDKILEALPSVRNGKVLHSIFWILGEFCDGNNVKQIMEVRRIIRDCLGPIPIVENELKNREEGNESNDVSTTTNAVHGSKLVTADGSYATQSALSVTTTKVAPDSNRPSIRACLFDQCYFIGTSLGNCFVKLAFKLKNVVDDRTLNSFNAECMLILASILHLGRAKLKINDPTKDDSINEDDFERISVCLQVLSQVNQSPLEVEQLMRTIFTQDTRRSLTAMINASEASKEQPKEKKVVKKAVETDDHLSFTQLLSRNQEMFENQFEISLSQAIGGNTGATATSSTFGKVSNISDLFSTSKLSKVTQLTGFSDPVYAECYVNVNQFDICLDVLIVNQTNDILQNCTLELSTMGDLKLVEKPTSIVLAPHDFANIKASVKVASTENGVIFGNIAYDVSGSTSDRNVVVLNDIHIDIMDYIIPASCSDSQFRTMWAEFEWENKVTVNTQMTDLQEFLSYMIKSINMKCLTPQKALSGDCSFLAANLYAKSIFGEDALANVSIEKTPDSPVTGHIRIRAKSQGMALSLGDKINVTQRAAKAG